MKRVVVVLFVVSMFIVVSRDLASSYYSFYGFYDNFGELNVKIGGHFFGKMNANYKNPDFNDRNGVRDSDIGVTFTGEYLISCAHLLGDIEILKLGAGFSYLLPTDINTSNSNYSCSYLPIYFTLQVNPFINSFDEYLHGIFVKGNIGYNVLFDFKAGNLPNCKFDNSGGIYYSFSTGYEVPFGVIIDLGYNGYTSTSKVSEYNSAGIIGNKESIDLAYSNITLSVGYKFKI
ncbi:MAG: hypothetical protein LBD17_02980 [Endomicrobium sp.]|nr:hypothetical protein [Endomicrobium sp.]